MKKNHFLSSILIMALLILYGCSRTPDNECFEQYGIYIEEEVEIVNVQDGNDGEFIIFAYNFEDFLSNYSRTEFYLSAFTNKVGDSTSTVQYDIDFSKKCPFKINENQSTNAHYESNQDKIQESYRSQITTGYTITLNGQLFRT